MIFPGSAQALSQEQAKRLDAAVRSLQAGNAGDALTLARRLVIEAPLAPDAQHLLAVCCAGAGAASEASQAFQRALALAPDNPQFLINIGRSAFDAGQIPLALQALERAVKLQPDSALAWHLLGNARRAGGDVEGAGAAFRQAVVLGPNSGTAWVNLGVVLRMLGRTTEALSCFDRASKTGYAGPELSDALAGTLLDTGRLGEAVEQARRLTREYPDFVPGYLTLAHLLWEHGAALKEENADVMFRAAVNSRPQNPALRLAFANFLLSAGRANEALAQIRVLQGRGPDPMLMALEADALALLGDSELAGTLYAKVHAIAGRSDPAFLNSYTRHLLKSGEYEAAGERAAETTGLDPNNQEAWAYLATVWRLLGDPREQWLCDYERLIGLVEVEPPAGYASTADFLSALNATLEPLHRASREPLQQTLRGGSQTPGRLFGRPDPVIAAAQSALLLAAERWLATLPTDPGHPFLKRKARSVRFSGSWSVRLWSAGKHVNHIHPEGWMSSAFYVSLPPSVTSQSADAGDAGCIQFGQPPVEFGLDLPPRRVIRPEAGKLALFPSFMWHGTVPFQDQEPRVTIAFDMTPFAG